MQFQVKLLVTFSKSMKDHHPNFTSRQTHMSRAGLSVYLRGLVYAGVYIPYIQLHESTVYRRTVVRHDLNQVITSSVQHSFAYL
jgi:hypothetical protein